MALTETQQIFEAWKRAESILVAFRPDPHHDGAASALALASVLEKLGKRVEVTAAGWQTPAPLSFLPRVETVKPKLDQIQKFMIEVDLARASLKDISYDVSGDRLRIALVPAAGTWSPNDVAAKPSEYRFDLICTVGTPDLESLGALFHTHADFFYHIPIVNIDHDAANEHYGQINHVDINATAVGEVLFDLITAIDRNLIDETVATYLLTGMIGKTRSFKTPNVTPKTLGAASELVAAGGRREEIVHHLYRTRTVPVLRLWGRALARLKHDSPTKFVWTLLAKQDFLHAGADAAALEGVIDELIINAPEARVAAIFYEDPTSTNPAGITCLLHAERPLSAIELARPFGGTGSRETVTFALPNKSLLEAELQITSAVKERVAQLKLH